MTQFQTKHLISFLFAALLFLWARLGNLTYVVQKFGVLILQVTAVLLLVVCSILLLIRNQVVAGLSVILLTVVPICYISGYPFNMPIQFFIVYAATIVSAPIIFRRDLVRYLSNR